MNSGAPKRKALLVSIVFLLCVVGVRRSHYHQIGVARIWQCGNSFGTAGASLTTCYTVAVIGACQTALLLTCACALLRKERKMSKLLSVMVASLFAASAFAADAPKTAAPEAKPAVEAAAPAKTPAKAHVAKKVSHTKHKAAKTTAPQAATPAPAATPAAAAPAPAAK
jgi:hypothetical protein